MSRQVTGVAERLWSKVDRNGPIPAHVPHLGPCWVWTAAVTENGYGRIRRDGGRSGQLTTAHRIAWELTHGEIGDSAIFVLHKCDRPRCCRPDHLFLGTHADNAADCAAKGREKDQRGSKHGLTRLTEADVVAMRAAFWSGERLKDVAARHGVRDSTASYIVHNRTWTHVPMPPAAAAAHAALRARGIMPPAEAEAASPPPPAAEAAS